jgi:hypothetical protein
VAPVTPAASAAAAAIAALTFVLFLFSLLFHPYWLHCLRACCKSRNRQYPGYLPFLCAAFAALAIAVIDSISSIVAIVNILTTHPFASRAAIEISQSSLLSLLLISLLSPPSSQLPHSRTIRLRTQAVTIASVPAGAYVPILRRCPSCTMPSGLAELGDAVSCFQLQAFSGCSRLLHSTPSRW